MCFLYFMCDFLQFAVFHLQEKRDHIVEELVSTERQYVETLHMLVEVRKVSYIY